MTISRIHVSRALILAALLFAVVWVLSGFYVMNLNHLWLGQGACGVQWGTTFAYHVDPNRGHYFAFWMLPHYQSFVFPPLKATLLPGMGPRVFIRQLTIPLFPILLTLAYVSFLIYPPRNRSDNILCPTCGYDLTGNVSGICPECGTAVGSIPAVGSESCAVPSRIEGNTREPGS